MSDASADRRSIELEVVVHGTPEQVWQAIATGPGISSWYVPHEVEERAGGVANARFGEGDDMVVPHRVAAWEPPERIVLDGGEGVDGLAFEWTIAPNDDGTCVVRLVNSGFGSGQPWDDQYDAMVDGWQMFLRNLQLHAEHFLGQAAAPILPLGLWSGSRAEVYERALARLGVASDVSVGDRVTLHADGTDAADIVGEVVEQTHARLTLLIEQPCPGTAFVAAEDYGEKIGVSVWAYFYGPNRQQAADRDRVGWQAWLNES